MAGLSTSYSKAETDIKLTRIKQAFGSGIDPEPLKIGDPIPTEYGGYILADVGDYGFGITEANKFNVGFLSAGGWEIVDIDMPNNNIPLNQSGGALGFDLFNNILGNYYQLVNTVNLVQQEPFAGFNLNNANQGIPGGTYWTYADSMYADFNLITAVDVKMINGTYNIFIFAKSNYNTPSQVIPVTNPTVGVVRVEFDPPLNPATHKVFVSGGVYYQSNAATVGVQNIVNGVLTNQGTVTPAMRLYGQKGDLVLKPQIEKRLTDLEKSEKFSNYIYNKSGGNITNITADGGVFSIASSGLTINSGGVTLEKQINLNRRYLELKTTLYSDTVIFLGTKNVENVVGENRVEINCSTKTLIIKPLGAGVDTTKVFNFNIVDGRQYIVRFYKLDEKDRVELIDTVTGDSEFLEAVRLAQFDKYKFGKSSGATPILISEISIVSVVKERPYMVFYGDSITEGNSVGSTTKTPYYRDRFPNLIGEKLGKPYLVSARSAGTINGVLNRMRTELPTLLPKYVCVTIGTNNFNTETNLNQLVDYCEGLGIKVILNLIPLYDGTTAAKNTIIQNVVTARKLMSIKMDLATSVNGDGQTKDNSKFANESGVLIHPNESGNLAIYKRALIDLDKLFAGVLP